MGLAPDLLEEGITYRTMKDTQMFTIHLMNSTPRIAAAIEADLNLRATTWVGRGAKLRPTRRSAEFGPIVHTFTAADAVANGTFVRLPKALATEVLYDVPVVLTKAVYEEVVLWERRQIETEDQRGFDVLWMAKLQALKALEAPGERFPFTMVRLENRTSDGQLSTSREWENTDLHVVAQPYNRSGDPCVTIMLPSED